MEKLHQINIAKDSAKNKQIDKLRSLTYSMDVLLPGLYFWCGSISFQIGGSEVDDEPYYYPFIVPTFLGIGFVLPNGFSWHTPFDSFKKIDEKRRKRSYRTIKGFGSTCAAR